MKVETKNDIFETELELVQIEVTGCCNMKCKHCRAAEQPKKIMNMEQISKIFDFISKVKADNFKLNLSGGEPFMHPKLIDIVELAKSKGLDEIVITTNASLVTDEMLEKLNNAGLKFLCLQVSIDSMNEKDHDVFRNYPGAYKKCDELLEKIKKYKNINSSIRMTLTKDTIDQVDDMIDYALLKNCKILGLGSVIPFGNAKDGNLSFKGDAKKKLMELVIEKRNKYAGEIDIVSEDPLKFLKLYEDNKLDIGYDITDPCIFGGCTAGISSLNINSDGTVTPCSMMDEEVLNINDYNTTKEIIKAYENSKIIKKLFEKKYSGKCGKCPLNRVCGGCRAAAKAYTGDFMGSDMSCWR